MVCFSLVSVILNDHNQMILIVLRIYILKIGNFLTYECCNPRKETGVISPTLLPHNGHLCETATFNSFVPKVALSRGPTVVQKDHTQDRHLFRR